MSAETIGLKNNASIGPLRMLLKWTMLVLGAASTTWIGAQDIHFSQYFNTPMALGPGSIGVFDGDQRIHASFRQQWRSVTTPYRTFGIGGDGRFLRKHPKLAFGAWLFHDRAGDSRLSQFHFNLGGSWTERIGAAKDGSLTIGAQFGLTSLSIDRSGLTFDDQYNGFYFDPTIGTSETFVRDSQLHPDLHAGLVYRYAPRPRTSIQAGVNFFNLTRPDIGFLNSPAVPLDLRTGLHVLAQFQITEKFDLLPRTQFMQQGKFTEFDLGANLRHIMLDRYGVLRAVQFGLHYRTRDAGYVYAGVEYDDWTFGASYDLNFSDLVPASRNRGAIEFSLIRIFRKRNALPVRFRACPDQL